MLPDSWRGHFVRVPAQVKNLRDTSGKMPELRPKSDLNKTSENLPTLNTYRRSAASLPSKRPTLMLIEPVRLNQGDSCRAIHAANDGGVVTGCEISHNRR